MPVLAKRNVHGRDVNPPLRVKGVLGAAQLDRCGVTEGNEEGRPHGPPLFVAVAKVGLSYAAVSRG